MGDMVSPAMGDPTQVPKGCSSHATARSQGATKCQVLVPAHTHQSAWVMHFPAIHPCGWSGVEQLRAMVCGYLALTPASGFPIPPAPLSLACPSHSSPQPTQALLYMELPIASVLNVNDDVSDL